MRKKHWPWRRLIATFALLWLSGCTESKSPADREYQLQGVVVSVSADKVEIDHEAVAGYMAAMQMSFPVTKPELLDGIKAGDKVHGRLSVRDGNPVLTELQKE